MLNSHRNINGRGGIYLSESERIFQIFQLEPEIQPFERRTVWSLENVKIVIDRTIKDAFTYGLAIIMRNHEKWVNLQKIT